MSRCRRMAGKGSIEIEIGKEASIEAIQAGRKEGYGELRQPPSLAPLHHVYREDASENCFNRFPLLQTPRQLQKRVRLKSVSRMTVVLIGKQIVEAG